MSTGPHNPFTGARRVTTPEARLRLVASEAAIPIDTARARRAIENENRAAASTEIDPADIRHALALRAADSLEGGRAALLRATKRRRLIDDAARKGLSPFEANLVIAIVQDAARRGEPPTSAAAVSRLDLVPAPARTTSHDRWFWLRTTLATAALTGLILNALIHWITSG